VAKPELGTKRTCPETGRKFYDLNRDPVISPYTGNSYPVSAFEVVVKGRGIPAAAKKEEAEEEAEVEVDTGDVELVSLEEADSDTPPKKKGAAADDDLEIEDDDDSDDTFLPDDEESDDDVSDLIDGDIEDDEEA
jgi:uncharacterized protein (TIGR02300 family)